MNTTSQLMLQQIFTFVGEMKNNFQDFRSELTALKAENETLRAQLKHTVYSNCSKPTILMPNPLILHPVPSAPVMLLLIEELDLTQVSTLSLLLHLIPSLLLLPKLFKMVLLIPLVLPPLLLIPQCNKFMDIYIEKIIKTR
jgi:hypothetical protein